MNRGARVVFAFFGVYIGKKALKNREKLQISILKIYLLLEKWPKMAINWFVTSFLVYFSFELRDFENFDFLTHFGGSEGQNLAKIGIF
jgi:hypothetical protein